MSRKIRKQQEPGQAKPTQTTAIYCRVSTSEQGDSGLSLEHQELRCRKFCESKEWNIYKTYIDVASAGSLDRPKLQELIRDAEQKRFQLIVFLRLDRISRVPRDFYNLVEDFSRMEINLATVENDVDTTTVQGRMLLGVLLQFASFEREINSERTRAALKQKALRGEFLSGTSPYGYDLKDKKLHINSEEAKNVKFIFKKYIIGEGPTEISRYLNERGYRTKIHRNKKGIARGGNKFTRKYIHELVTNPVYAGKIFARGEMLPGIHKPIIEEEIFKKVQDIVRKNAEDKHLGKSVRGPLLLNGLLKCGYCNRYMTTHAGTGRSKTYYYYACSTTVQKGASSCPSNQVKSEDIEYLVLEVIKKIAQDNQFLTETLALINKVDENIISELQKDLNQVFVERKSIQDQQKSLAKSFGDYDLTKIEAIAQEIKNSEEHVMALKNRENELKLKISNYKSNVVDQGKLQELYKEFYSIWTELDKPEKRNIIQILIKEIETRIAKNSNEGEIKITLWTDIPQGMLSRHKVGSSLCHVKLRRAGEKTNHIILPFQIRYMQYKQGGTYYYFPEVTIENGRLNATFYRNRGLKGV